MEETSRERLVFFYGLWIGELSGAVNHWVNSPSSLLCSFSLVVLFPCPAVPIATGMVSPSFPLHLYYLKPPEYLSYSLLVMLNLFQHLSLITPTLPLLFPYPVLTVPCKENLRVT
jgi:hypothetical protein